MYDKEIHKLCSNCVQQKKKKKKKALNKQTTKYT